MTVVQLFQSGSSCTRPPSLLLCHRERGRWTCPQNGAGRARQRSLVGLSAPPPGRGPVSFFGCDWADDGVNIYLLLSDAEFRPNRPSYHGDYFWNGQMDLLPENRQSCHDDAGEEGNDDDIAVSVIWRVSPSRANDRTRAAFLWLTGLTFIFFHSVYLSRGLFLECGSWESWAPQYHEHAL